MCVVTPLAGAAGRGRRAPGAGVCSRSGAVGGAASRAKHAGGGAGGGGGGGGGRAGEPLLSRLVAAGGFWV
eukprot:1190210-Prorocentrum_minimum.AAC.1